MTPFQKQILIDIEKTNQLHYSPTDYSIFGVPTTLRKGINKLISDGKIVKIINKKFKDGKYTTYVNLLLSDYYHKNEDKLWIEN